jgi:hypothetical protein
MKGWRRTCNSQEGRRGLFRLETGKPQICGLLWVISNVSQCVCRQLACHMLHRMPQEALRGWEGNKGVRNPCGSLWGNYRAQQDLS